MRRFYVGLHQPSDAQHFDNAFVSINRLRDRRSPFVAHRWVMDSGAFTELSNHGRYRHSVSEYADDARRWIGNGQLDAVVAQDWMCEPFILDRTGLTVADHQRLTIARYDELLAALSDTGVYILPVLQGFAPAEYATHVDAYGDRLAHGAWVGVGSVCKRQGDPAAIVAVLEVIKARRPDLRLHGFGVKLTALKHAGVRDLLDTADSMAWSYAARKQGRNGNDWREAKAFETKVCSAASARAPWQPSFVMGGASW